MNKAERAQQAAEQREQADNASATIFMARMMPHMLAGMTFEQAGQAVLEQDKQLHKVATSNTEEGEMIRRQLAAQVYAEVHA